MLRDPAGQGGCRESLLLHVLLRQDSVISSISFIIQSCLFFKDSY